MSEIDIDDESKSKDNIEIKYCGKQELEVKEEIVNGVQVGIVKGYIATWDLDRGNDQFKKGAFRNSLIKLRDQKRQIRFKDNHYKIIGGFPIDQVFEDEKGLFGVGHINLDVQLGKEAFSLAKQGVLSDFSVGFSVEEFEIINDIRIINKAIIWEGSLVDEPMNPFANVTEVKKVVSFQDLKIADRNQKWDTKAALSRIREFTDSDDVPSTQYKNAFVWFDSKESNLFESYKLLIADIVDGRMKIVPKALFSAAAILQGARGGIDLPENDRPKVIRHIERYYAKMDLDSPFSEKQYFVSSDVLEWTSRDLEKYLKLSDGMSKSACKIIASRLEKKKIDNKKIDNEDEINYKQIKTVLMRSSSSMKDILSKLKEIH